MMGLSDNSLMPWGKHKGRKMEDVPADYLHFMYTKDGFDQKSEVGEYITKNLMALMKECPDRIWT